jgi:hypothetical protein
VFDRSLGDDASLAAVAGWDRGHLDHEPTLRPANLERRVIEVTGTPPLEPRGDCLEDAPVQPHRMVARSQRQPVQVDARVIGGHVSRPFLAVGTGHGNHHPSQEDADGSDR